MVKCASETFWPVFQGKSGLAFPKAACQTFCRLIPPLISPANFASETFRRNVVVAVKFGVVVPENLRNTKECLSARCVCVGGRTIRPYGKADGAGLTLDIEE